MLPLDLVLQAGPPHQVAGHFGIDVAGLLRPPGSSASGDEVGTCSLATLSPSMDLGVLFRRTIRSPVPRSTLDGHLLVLQPQGQFSSTDHLSLAGVRLAGDQLTADLVVTRSESVDGEPAPRLLVVLLHVDAGDATLRELVVSYHGRHRPFRGPEAPLPGQLAPPHIIAISPE
jgi:hypothetical protein